MKKKHRLYTQIVLQQAALRAVLAAWERSRDYDCHHREMALAQAVDVARCALEITDPNKQPSNQETKQ